MGRPASHPKGLETHLQDSSNLANCVTWEVEEGAKSTRSQGKIHISRWI